MTCYRTIIIVVLGAVALAGCVTAARPAPAVSPVLPQPSAKPTCAPVICDPPAAAGGLYLAFRYIATVYPEQDIAGLDWQEADRRPRQPPGEIAWHAGDWALVEDLARSSVVVTNTVTGFKWVGEVGSRPVPWSDPCCVGMNYEEYIVETSVAILPPAAPTLTPSPTATPTPAATQTPTDTPAPTPTPAPSTYDPAALLPRLAEAEFDLSYNTFQGMTSLVVWYVEPVLAGPSDDVAALADAAIESGIQQAHALAVADPCVGEPFTHVNPIVVDPGYAGWFSGLIPIEALPGKETLTPADLEPINRRITEPFVRTEVPATPGEPPADACDWTAARERIQARMGGDERNTAAYIVDDPNGRTVYAQWIGQSMSPEGPLDFDDPMTYALALASTGDVALQLICVHPPMDRLVVSVVDADGALRLVGLLPREAMLANELSQFRYQVFP